MRLELLQASFAEALLDAGREGTLEPLLATAGRPAVERFALYRGNIRAAREKALAHVYPVVRAVVGEAFFAALASAYGDKHPSTSGDLNRFGANLSAFVSAFEHTRTLPYLADLAALEWQVHRAHYAADADGLSRDRMAAISPQNLLATRFTLHPAIAWCASRFPVVSIWRAHQPRAVVELPANLDKAEYALVARPRWRVEVIESSAAELAALSRLRGGADMDSMIGAALAEDVRFDFGKTLVRWLDLAVLVDMHRGD